MPRVIIGRANRLRPDPILRPDMRVIFYVTNQDDNDAPLRGARVRIQEIGGTGREFCNDVTDARGEVTFDVAWRQDIPITIRIRHADAVHPFDGITKIGPEGIDLKELHEHVNRHRIDNP